MELNIWSLYGVCLKDCLFSDIFSIMQVDQTQNAQQTGDIKSIINHDSLLLY